MSRASSFIRDSFIPHVLGGLLGGVAAGILVAGAAATLELVAPDEVVAVAAVLALAALCISEVMNRRAWWSADRQVPRDFQRTRYHRTTAFLWGIDLGFGWSTKQPSAALTMTTIAALLAGPEVALASGAVFGVARASTLAAAAGSTDRDAIERRFSWFAKRPAVPRIGTAVFGAMLIVAVVGVP